MATIYSTTRPIALNETLCNDRHPGKCDNEWSTGRDVSFKSMIVDRLPVHQKHWFVAKQQPKLVALVSKNAPSGNRTRVTSMATIYSTTRPIARFEIFAFITHPHGQRVRSRDKKVHLPGIGPESPVWETDMLPLHHRC